MDIRFLLWDALECARQKERIYQFVAVLISSLDPPPTEAAIIAAIKYAFLMCDLNSNTPPPAPEPTHKYP